MVKSEYIKILENPQTIQDIEVKELKNIVDTYPYFQSAHSLYLKGLKFQESFKYNNKLKLTAAYTSDRTILFDFITSSNFNISEEVTQEQPLQEPNPIISAKESISEIEESENNLAIGKPLSFKKDETHSFNQWLQLSVSKPINRDIKIEETDTNSDIINRFIINNPKISKLDKNSTTSIKVVEKDQYPQLMTETLAKVYLEQKKYENAIKAYEILSLKYPEKSGFFADHIKQIRILQNIK